MTNEIDSLYIPKASSEKCVECGRVFNLLDDKDAGEFQYGHDCEVQNEATV